ncbi:MAG: oligosaccharide flippase family protein [Candidatus Parcubacteria bacterium]|nr:oligosaccharide flippase family protein [Candidatus Parcubacteria bacterium]
MKILYHKTVQNIKQKLYNLLRWSEKWTKTDMVYLAHGGFWLTLGQIISSFSVFLLAVAFANLLPKETYGIYKYALSLTGILTALSLTGMNAAVTQAVARGFEGTLKKSFWIQLRWSVLMISAAAGGSVYYFLRGNKVLGFALIIIGVFSPILNSANTYTAFLSGKKDFKNLSKYSAISSIVWAATVFFTLILTKNPVWLIFAYLISTTGINIFFYVYSIKKIKSNEEIDSKSISYGKHLSLINVFGTIASYLDNILVFHYLGSAPLAIYNFASAPADQAKGLLTSVPTLAMPKIVPHSLKETDAIIRKRLPQLILTGALIAAIYIILIPYVFKIFFPKYPDSIFFSRLYGITIAFMPINFLLSAVLNAKLTYIPKNWLYRIVITAQAILIVSLLLLTPILGITGAVISKIIFSLSVTILNLYYWKKLIKIDSLKLNSTLK